jgi:hypothetical protein
VLEIVEKYPFDKKIIQRKSKFGLTKNILEGMKEAFNMSSDYIIYIEDDVVLHKTYFKYLKGVITNKDVGKFSIISPYNFNDDGDVCAIRRADHYAALAPLISKEFFTKYVLQHAKEGYYKNPSKYIQELNLIYKDYWDKGYKYRDSTTHNEQAGCIHRIANAVAIKDNIYVIMPRVNRQIHIGFYGKNRRGGIIPGRTFEERLESLREIIKNNRFFEMAGDKRYNDYKVFSDKLNDWDGNLYIEKD